MPSELTTPPDLSIYGAKSIPIQHSPKTPHQMRVKAAEQRSIRLRSQHRWQQEDDLGLPSPRRKAIPVNQSSRGDSSSSLRGRSPGAFRGRDAPIVSPSASSPVHDPSTTTADAPTPSTPRFRARSAPLRSPIRSVSFTPRQATQTSTQSSSPFPTRLSLADRAAKLGYKPPWDASPPEQAPRERSLFAEELAMRPLPTGVPLASLSHFLEKVRSRMDSTRRRLGRAIEVLNAANAHAVQRYSTDDDVAMDRLSASVLSLAPTKHEWDLILASEHVGHASEGCTAAAGAHREYLQRLEQHLEASVSTLAEQSEALKRITQTRLTLRPFPPSASNDEELFRIQRDVHAASDLETHIRSACIDATHASRRQVSRVESATAMRVSVVHSILSSPERLTPEARVRAKETGFDAVVKNAVRSGEGRLIEPPMTLLRGKYLGGDELEPMSPRPKSPIAMLPLSSPEGSPSRQARAATKVQSVHRGRQVRRSPSRVRRSKQGLAPSAITVAEPSKANMATREASIAVE